MIIVINAFSAKVGGGVTYLKNLLSNIPNEISLEVHVFGDFDENDFPDPRLIFPNTKWPTHNPYTRLVWEVFSLRRYLIAVKADLLFCPGGIVNTSAPHGCKVVTMFRNMLPFDIGSSTVDKSLKFKIKNFLLRRTMLRSMKMADLVIFISEYAKSVIEDYITVKDSVTIYHGINESFRPVTIHERPILEFQGEYILYVSRFEPYKRHFELVKAYSLLSKELKAKYSLLIVGGGEGKSERRVKKFIQDNELSESVFLMPSVSYDEIVPLYHHASVFTFMSACENCPNILLEALASELPIVCSNVQPMPEFASDAVVYTSPDDIETIYHCLENVLSNSELRSSLSISSRKRAAEYDWKITASKTWRVLLDVAAFPSSYRNI